VLDAALQGRDLLIDGRHLGHVPIVPIRREGA
jgi:hypothetical protein